MTSQTEAWAKEAKRLRAFLDENAAPLAVDEAVNEEGLLAPLASPDEWPPFRPRDWEWPGA